MCLGFAETTFRRVYDHGRDFKEDTKSGSVTQCTVEGCARRFVHMLVGETRGADQDATGGGGEGGEGEHMEREAFSQFSNHDRHVALMSNLLGRPSLGLDFVGRLDGECLAHDWASAMAGSQLRFLQDSMPMTVLHQSSSDPQVWPVALSACW